MVGETIVVTRPAGDETALTELLHERNYRVIHEPLMQIFLQHTQRQALEQLLNEDPDACIVTSRHGVQALAALSELRDLYLICVGESTAHMAQTLGYDRIAVAGGNVNRLVEYISHSYDEGSRFIYLSGEHVRMDIESVLSQMQVTRLALYEAVASTQLSDTLIEHLRREQIDAITLMSPRTAQIFSTLVEQANAQESLRHLNAIALSAAVAEPLASLPWKGIHITREATLASIAQTVDNAFRIPSVS